MLRWGTSNSTRAFDVLAPYGSSRVAPLAAHCLHALESARDAGADWLLRFPEAAAVGLVPAAVAKPSQDRDAAAAALRLLAERGHRELVLAVAARWSEAVVDAVADALDYDPLDLYPAKLPKLPAFWSAAAFTRPRLASGGALPVAAMDHLATMLAFSPPDAPYPGVQQVKDACTPASLAAFAWDLFSAWQIAGWPAKEAWAFRALASFGDDACARQLALLVRAWPGEAAHARAVTGLTCSPPSAATSP